MKKKLSASHLAAQPAGLIRIEFVKISNFCSGYFSIPAFLCFQNRRCLIISSKENQINEEIREKEVRVIDTDGSQLGIMPTSKALTIAAEKKLDLVNIAPSAKPPVCKILDYGKYRYELQKKEKEARKKQKITQVKEIRVSTFIEGHDLQVKAKNAAKFLQDGDKVKVSLRFRGREKGYANVGKQVMEKFAEAVSEVGVIEKKPMLEGRSMIMVLAPKKD